MESFPQYGIYYVFVIYSANVVTCVFGSVDGSYAYFTFLLSTIFMMIQFDIEELFSKYDSLDDKYFITSKKEVSHLKRELGRLIRKQNVTYSVSKEFIDLFGVIIFAHFFTSAITICSGCVVMQLVRNKKTKLQCKQ